ncbi:adenylate kinase [Apiospora arundinis]
MNRTGTASLDDNAEFQRQEAIIAKNATVGAIEKDKDDYKIDRRMDADLSPSSLRTKFDARRISYAAAVSFVHSVNV